MPRTLAEIRASLATIDSYVEPVAVKHPAGSDMNVLAYAIHNLVGCVEDLAKLLGRAG